MYLKGLANNCHITISKNEDWKGSLNRALYVLASISYLMVDGIDIRSVWILFLLSFICIWFQEKGISHYRSWDPEFWPVWYRTSIWCGWEEDRKTVKFHRFVKLKISPLQFGVSVWGSVLSWIKEKYVIFDSHTIFQSFKNVHFTLYLLPTLFT